MACRLYTTDMYSDVTCKGSLAHSLNRSLNPTLTRQLVRTFVVMIMYFFIFIFIIRLRGTQRGGARVGSHVGSPYPYIIMRYIRFFLRLYFLCQLLHPTRTTDLDLRFLRFFSSLFTQY